MNLLSELDVCPLVASVQASPGSPLGDSGTLVRLALASGQEGVRVLRLEGIASIRAVRRAIGLPTIGLIKVPGGDVAITPTLAEVDALIAEGCEVVAMDATPRPRPGGARLPDLLARVHSAGRLALADCDSEDSLRAAAALGFDLLATTLAGYTGRGPVPTEPDLELVRVGSRLRRPLLAEGRYSEPWQVAAALRAGAAGVVAGAAINDPGKQTRRLAAAAARHRGPAGAFDLGGTWIRFGVFDADWRLVAEERAEMPSDPGVRLAWMRERIARSGVDRVGVGSGGQVDPKTGMVVEAKPMMPGHVGFRFDRETLGVETVALNDGLAQAWGHACAREFAGLRVATLALGTGVGAGFVAEGRIQMGPQGEYLRLNDLPGPGGKSYEDLLGGAFLGIAPDDEAKALAKAALDAALKTLAAACRPDAVVLSGAVGLADWIDPAPLDPVWGPVRIATSPFGAKAGLFGAAALALFPPRL